MNRILSKRLLKNNLVLQVFDFSDGGSEDYDELFGEAKETVVKAGKASASFLQRKLKIGYARAARIIDLLEEQGVVGPANGAKPRAILVLSLIHI